MVLIKISSSGGVTRQCDARCYNASDHMCRCVCGGANHGRGLEQAKVNTELAGKTLARNWIQTRNLKRARIQIGTWERVQIPLFENSPRPRAPRAGAAEWVH